MVPSNRPGTMWEMETLRTANLLHKVIFIMPPRSKGDLDTRASWELAREAMTGHGLEPPAYDDRGLLFEVGPDGRICNVEAMLLTSPRQVRKSLKRLLSYDGQSGGFLKAAAKAERRARRSVFLGWAETLRQLSVYGVVAIGLFAAHPDLGLQPGGIVGHGLVASLLCPDHQPVPTTRSSSPRPPSIDRSKHRCRRNNWMPGARSCCRTD